jgi:hypothetical protein
VVYEVCDVAASRELRIHCQVKEKELDTIIQSILDPSTKQIQFASIIECVVLGNMKLYILCRGDINLEYLLTLIYEHN